MDGEADVTGAARTSRRRFLGGGLLTAATVAASTARGLFRPGGTPAAAAAGVPLSAGHGPVTLMQTAVPGASVSILDYGGVGDGAIGAGSINAGAAVATLAHGPRPVRVGQLVSIAGAGPKGAALDSVVAAVPPQDGLGANQFRIEVDASTSATGTGVMWGTNNRDALAKALLALTELGGGEVEIPPGGYLVSGGIDAWPPGADPLPGDVGIRGRGGASQILLAGGPSTYCTFYRVNSVTIKDLAVRGTPAGPGIPNPVDCDVAFRFLNRRGVLDNVWFYGVSGASAVVSTYGCDLVVNGGGFLGCAATHKDVVHCDEWAGVTVRETEFLDFGSMHGAFHAKSSQNPLNTSRSWIGIFNPQMDLTKPVGGVNGSRCIRIENARFDEGTLNHVLIQPGALGTSTEGGERRITAVDISGTPALVLSEAAARGFNINKVDHLTVRHCHFTAFNADGGERTAIQLADVRDTKLERVVATTHAGRIAAGAGCVSLFLEECAYGDLVVDPATRLRTLRDGQD